MTAAGSDEGPVARYLDEMFNLLAGTGANGRRLLVEAEEHLVEAAAEGRARGLDSEAAEREAVDRFGAATLVARRVPTDGTVRVSLPRMATWVWAFTSVALAWYGLSGALAWTLSRPWTQLLIATDRFGAHPMCELPWVPETPIDCVGYHQQDLSLVPGAGNDFPYLVVAGLGVLLGLALVIARRTTAVGSPSWTPSRTAVGAVFAVLYGLAAVALAIEAIDGVAKDVQYYVLADIAAALLAGGVSAAAWWWARRKPIW